METVAGVIGFKVTEGTRHSYMRLAAAKVSIFGPEQFREKSGDPHGTEQASSGALGYSSSLR